MNLDRLISLIGKENVETIKNLNILVIGIGGVGGYTLESLVRSGVEHITIVDNDVIDPTNLNRQIITTTKNIGKYKVDEAIKRSKEINPNINIIGIKEYLTKENISLIYDNKYDYIIDACDTTDTKIELIKECTKNNIKLISSMGTAKKTDASKLQITTLDKTSYDKLAKKIRKELTSKEMKHTIVVSSIEECKDINVLGSTSYLPGIAGLLITNYIINDIIKTRN